MHDQAQNNEQVRPARGPRSPAPGKPAPTAKPAGRLPPSDPSPSVDRQEPPAPAPLRLAAARQALDTSLSARFAARRRIIDAEPDAERRRLLEFFYDLDLQTDPGMFETLGLSAEESSSRRKAIEALRPALKAWALAHAAHVGRGGPVAVMPQDTNSAHLLSVSKLLHDVMKRHLSRKGKPGVDMHLLRKAFERFALGQLFTGPAPADSAPDSAHFVSFATFAIWAGGRKHELQSFWNDSLHVFVASTRQYLRAYKPLAPAFSMYTVRQPLPWKETPASEWVAWEQKTKPQLLREFGALMAEAFAINVAQPVARPSQPPS
ncbi:MAG: hypothetical protein R3F56_10665 [Planctomycetota bacterium]